jgi:integrase
MQPPGNPGRGETGSRPVLLTAEAVKAATATGRRLEIRDTRVTGLILRVSPRGVKSWSVWSRPRAGGKPVRVGIGRWPRWSLKAAREEAERILRELDLGHRRPRPATIDDPLRSMETLGKACLAALAPRLSPATMDNWQRYLQREIVPLWGQRDPRTLDRREVRAAMEQLRRRAPVAANRCLTFLRRVFSWAIEQDLLVVNPCAGVKPPHVERPRERVLSLAELGKVWGAATAEGPQGAIVHLLILTAARRGEVLGMRWADLELAGAEPVWRAPGSLRKGGEPLVLPLVARAAGILRGLRPGKKRRRSEWVFPAPGGEASLGTGQSITERIRARSGVSYTVHDLRRTVASHLAAHGTPVDVIEAILGHRRPLLVRTYQRYAPLRAMREALEWWAGLLA